VEALGAATVPLLIAAGPAVDPEQLAVLAAAIAGHEPLRFGYRAGDGTESRRLAEPHRLVAAGRRWYLLAYDNDQDDWRIFRVDRVRDLQPTGARSAPREPPGSDAAAYVTGKLVRNGPHLHGRRDPARAGRGCGRRLGDAAGALDPLDERTCRLRSRADTLEWLAFRLATLGCEFDVHQPPELAEYLRTLGARVTRAARSAG